MPNKTKTDVQINKINTSYWILIIRTKNKKRKTKLMLKIYSFLPNCRGGRGEILNFGEKTLKFIEIL